MEAGINKLKSILKFVAALAVPIAIAYFFYISQKQADLEVAEYKKMQQENPNTDRVTIDNYELKEVGDDNRIRWQLVAKKGVMEPSNRDVLLAQVKVQYYDKDEKLKLKLWAPCGLANEGTKKVELLSKEGQRVMAEGEEGKTRMEAGKVELTKKNQFVATGGVNIVWAGVAKVTGNQASGSLEKNAELKEMKVVGNTHTLLKGK